MNGQYTSNITNRMDLVESKIESSFTDLFCQADFDIKIREANEAKPDRRPFVLKELVKMLKDIGVECESGKDLEYYNNLVDTLVGDAINAKMLSYLENLYANYPRPDEFMERIVNRLDPATQGSSSLQMRILKRFMATVNVPASVEVENKDGKLMKKNCNPYYAAKLRKLNTADIDEAVFAMPEYNGQKKNLIKASYNLAKGIFVSPAMSKETLFLFAFAYDMRYYPSKASGDYCAEKDVVKNLFEDFYCDNLARYIYMEDGGVSGNSDVEPSGVGLNLKNFVDVTFIYYLNQNLTASEKVSKFYQMLNSVKEAWNQKHEQSLVNKQPYEDKLTTKYVSELLSCALGLEENAFKNYLLENYYCDVRCANKNGTLQNTGFFEFAVAVNSPYEQYCDIIDGIKTLLGHPNEVDFSKIDREAKAYVCELEQNIPVCEGFCQISSQFASVFENIQKRLNPYDALAVTDSSKMTRTKLIAAYYHYYCILNDADSNNGNYWKSFKAVYDDMTSCLNPYLVDAGYQELSSKNLYDVFVIFLAYCSINNITG